MTIRKKAYSRTISMTEGEDKLVESVGTIMADDDKKLQKANGAINLSRLFKILLIEKAIALGIKVSFDNIFTDRRGDHQSPRPYIYTAITSVNDDEWFMLVAGKVESEVEASGRDIIQSVYPPKYHEELERNLRVVLKAKARRVYGLNLDIEKDVLRLG